jgi:hypothetical protein
MRFWFTRKPKPGARRILVPFSGGTLDSTVLDAAIRIARAEDATLVPAYLLLVPLRYSEESPLGDDVAVAMPLLEAVERAARCDSSGKPRGSTASSCPRAPAATGSRRRT